MNCEQQLVQLSAEHPPQRLLYTAQQKIHICSDITLTSAASVRQC